MFAHVCVIQNMFVLWSQAACLWNYTEFLIRRACVIRNVFSRNVSWCLCVCVWYEMCVLIPSSVIWTGAAYSPADFIISLTCRCPAHFNILPSHVCTLPNISANWKWACWQQVKQRCKITQHMLHGANPFNKLSPQEMGVICSKFSP